jgi:hypothetical protein
VEQQYDTSDGCGVVEASRQCALRMGPVCAACSVSVRPGVVYAVGVLYAESVGGVLQVDAPGGAHITAACRRTCCCLVVAFEGYFQCSGDTSWASQTKS